MRSIFIGLLFSLITIVGFSEPLYSFDSPEKTDQFHHLLSTLRCPVCQNQDLAESNAGIAKDLRFDVYRMVQQGQSDAEITHYLTDRYGDFILFDPPVKLHTLLLWFGPLLFIISGLVIFYIICIKRESSA